MEAGESIESALRRELDEELGWRDLGPMRLRWVIENLYEVRGRLWHEIGFYLTDRIDA